MAFRKDDNGNENINLTSVSEALQTLNEVPRHLALLHTKFVEPKEIKNLKK